MVVLPYKDRLLLMSRYLQQLVMESLGKEHDLDGNVVNQGLAVYGNKGSTDQHAYVQQLRDGLDNFFVTFIVVHQDVARPGGHEWTTVDDEGATAGDYLHGFWQGTREALWQKRRGSISIICRKLDAKTLGALIALFERAVGLYAELIHVNAYHQPGVEAGKKAAASVLELQHQVVASLQEDPETFFSAEELAQRIEQPDKTESIYHLLQHLALNKRGVQKHRRTFAVLPPKVKRTRDW
jgi:glucose-6-phosphate isomerase